MKDGFYFAGGGFRLNTRSVPGDVSAEDIWWRADDKRYAYYDPFDEFCAGWLHLAIELTPYVVTKVTPKGVKLRAGFGREFFVLGSAVRQQAVPTKELALADLAARKRRHVGFAELRLKHAKQCLAATEHALAQIGELS
jgi:hypothetical protein